MTQPTIGRIVHYKSYGTPGGEYGSECRAAIVTEVPPFESRDEVVGLAVLNPGGLFFNRAKHDEDQAGGTWHWPCVRAEEGKQQGGAIYRSAVTGRIVSEDYAQKHPDTTVREETD